MTWGVRIRKDDGTLICDASTNLGTNVGTVAVGKFNGSYSLPSDVPGTLAYVIGGRGPGYYQPKIAKTNGGRTLTWTWPSNGANFNEEFTMRVIVK